MSILVRNTAAEDEYASTKSNTNRDPLIAELYDQARGNMQLLMIYKKIEIAAKSGDWILMNELYGEFKYTKASMN
jgi:hypothetical protein